MNPEIDLDALTALEQGLPPAPWHMADTLPAPSVRTEGGWEVAYTSYTDSGPAVAAFIAAARNNWSALLSALTATRAKLERDHIELRDKRSDLLDIRGALSPNGYARRVPMELGATVAPAIEWLLDDRDAARAELDERRQRESRIWQRIQAWSDDPATRLEAFAITWERVEAAERERDAARQDVEYWKGKYEAGAMDQLAAAPTINSAGVGSGNCNCQAIKDTPNYPGPWHPRGDTPTCLKLAAPAAAPKPTVDSRCGDSGPDGAKCVRTVGHEHAGRSHRGVDSDGEERTWHRKAAGAGDGEQDTATTERAA